MKTTSTLAITAALALFAAPVMAQDQTAPTMPQTTPPAASDTGTTGTSTMPSTTPGTAEVMPPAASTTDTAAAPSTAAPTFLQAQTDTQFLGSNLMGADVRSAADEDLGDVNDVVFDMNGKAVGVVVGVGGFLGIGEKNVAIPFERVTITRPDANDDDIRISLDTTKDELNGAPEFTRWAPATAASATTEGVTPNTTGSTVRDGGTATDPAAPVAPTAPAQ